MTTDRAKILNVYSDETDWFVATDLDDCKVKAVACWGQEHQNEDEDEEWILVADDAQITIAHEDIADVPEVLRARAVQVREHLFNVTATAREWADNYGEGTGFLCSTEY